MEYRSDIENFHKLMEQGGFRTTANLFTNSLMQINGAQTNITDLLRQMELNGIQRIRYNDLMISGIMLNNGMRLISASGKCKFSNMVTEGVDCNFNEIFVINIEPLSVRIVFYKFDYWA